MVQERNTEALKDILEKYYIIRTSWVFGEYGANFVYTMKRLAEEHSELTVIDDQLGRPTWTKNLAEFMIHLVETNPDYGIYHFSNLGSGSWFDFAEEILKDSKVRVEPILTRDYYQKAQRPKKSIMSLSKALNTGFVIPHWERIVSTCLEAVRVIPDLRFAGWDCVVLPDGGIDILEGNHGPDVDVMQSPLKRGIRLEIKDMLKSYFDYDL